MHESVPGSNYAVARQPIYRVADGKIFGYELLYRTLGGGNQATIPSDEEATLAVLANGIHAISQDVRPRKRLFINFPREILEKGYYRFLDKDRFVLEVLESVRCDEAFTALIRSMREAGYVLALDDYVGDASFDAILPLMDFVKVDMLALRDDPLHRDAVITALNASGKQILAEKVETADDIRLCLSHGIPLAQGFFYCRPQIVTAKILDVNQAVKLQLLAEVTRPDIDVGKIRDIIGSDVSLTYKLLRYVNTARFYRGQPIESVEFAVKLLGRDALASWTAVNLLTSLGSSPREQELAFASAVRGRFLALLNAKRKRPCHQEGGVICLLGLLSLLDAMLGLPMRQALEHLHIDPGIRRALLGQPSPNQPCLQLIREYDRGPEARLTAILHAMGLTREQAANASLEAIGWVAAMFCTNHAAKTSQRTKGPGETPC